MVWADKKGHISWQTVGIAPVRNHHSGMVPVPGDGRYDWDGYLPVLKRPAAYDPDEGFICTANENRTPPDYPYMNSIGYSWSDAFRHDRIQEVLGSKNKITMEDMQALQTDYYSMTARSLISLLKELQSTDSNFIKAKKLLLEWDLFLKASSVAATVYVSWEHWLETNLLKQFQLDNIKGEDLEFNTKKMIDLLNEPDKRLGENVVAARDQLLVSSLEDAMKELTLKLGSDMSNWQWGQLKMKHVWIKHALSNVVNEKVQSAIDAGPVARGGNENSVNSTGSSMNQMSGASFRVLIDCADWDLMKAINTPGQSGDPNSVHYKDLFDLWSKDEYFSLYFSKEKINSVKEKVLVLSPK